jgi:hypothetical protein
MDYDSLNAPHGCLQSCLLSAFVYYKSSFAFMQGSYHVGNTASRPISEVKQRWALLVLTWETSLEPRVTLRFFQWNFFFDPYAIDPTPQAILVSRKSDMSAHFSLVLFTSWKEGLGNEVIRARHKFQSSKPPRHRNPNPLLRMTREGSACLSGRRKFQKQGVLKSLFSA